MLHICKFIGKVYDVDTGMFSPGFAILYVFSGSRFFIPEYGSQVGSSKSSHLTRKRYLDSGCFRVSPDGL